MKRIIALTIAATLICCLLSACGKPSNVSDEMYSIGENALQVADDYMAYKIDGNTARTKIDVLSDDATTVYERNKGTDYYTGDLGVATYIHSLATSIHTAAYKGVPADIKGKRNDLAKRLGK